MKFICIILALIFSQTAAFAQNSFPYILILGTAQDGGYPHIGCRKQCCEHVWENDSLKTFVVSLALADPSSGKWWLFEATPDITQQLHLFQQLTESKFSYLPNGILITHAHIGHYTGLMQLGREAMSAKDVPVYVLPKMKSFLETNGPWSQLVNLHNIRINVLRADSTIQLSENISVMPFTVPHRDEYSETAGFKINTSSKKYLFIPDIDKWSKWNKNIVDEVMNVDHAFLDATFYSIEELPGRDMSQIPHPLVSETMELFKNENDKVKNNIVFIHFNHTNPLIWDAEVRKEVMNAGFGVAAMGEKW